MAFLEQRERSLYLTETKADLTITMQITALRMKPRTTLQLLRHLRHLHLLQHPFL